MPRIHNAARSRSRANTLVDRKPSDSRTAVLAQSPTDPAPRATRSASHKSGEVASVLRGLAILRSFTDSSPWLGNSEIALRTNLPKSTVSRLTATLAAHGYLDVDSVHRRYRLGPAVLLLGYTQLASWNLRQVARPHLKALADYGHAVVALAAPLEGSMIYLECQRGPADITVNMDVGSRVPMDLTAIGWAYLYALAPAPRDVLLQRIRQRRGDAWTKIKTAMDRAFAEIDKRGFCIAAGFWKSDISAVGVPLRIPSRSIVLALNCGAPRSKLSTEQLTKELGPRLVQVARRIATSAGES